MNGRINFSGLWRADMSRSRVLGRPVSRLLMKITHYHSNFNQWCKTEYLGGGSRRFVFRALTTDVGFVNIVASRAWHSRAFWQGEELVIVSRVKSGKGEVEYRDHWVYRDDALLMEHRDGALAGQVIWLIPAPEIDREFDRRKTGIVRQGQR